MDDIDARRDRPHEHAHGRRFGQEAVEELAPARGVVEMLARRGELSASEISEEFDVTPQAVSQHLRVLREASVIQMERRAQHRFYTFNPKAVNPVQAWVGDMVTLWTRRLDRLERALKEDET